MPRPRVFRPALRFFCLIAAIVLVLLAADRGLLLLGEYLYPKKYSAQVEKYAEEYGVDKYLVYAIIKCESNFNPNAQSDVGALGLMQLTEETFLWAGEQVYSAPIDAALITEPETNIRCGVWYISYLQKHFSGEKEVIAAYNAGPTKVNNWLKDSRYSENGKTLTALPFKETENHIKKVQKARQRYIKLYESR